MEKEKLQFSNIWTGDWKNIVKNMFCYLRENIAVATLMVSLIAPVSAFLIGYFKYIYLAGSFSHFHIPLE